MIEQATLDMKNILVKMLEKEHVSEINIYEKPIDWIDCAIIGTATSPRHLYSLTEKIKRTSIGKPHIEGRASSGWIIIDFQKVIIHLFTHESREYYTLDDLWNKTKEAK